MMTDVHMMSPGEASAFVQQMDDAATKLLDEIGEEGDRRVRVLLSFWLGLGKGATQRAQEAEAKVAELTAEVSRLRTFASTFADALLEAANVDGLTAYEEG